MSTLETADRSLRVGVLGLLALVVAAGASMARATGGASAPGLALVAGGTLASLLLTFTTGDVARALRSAALPGPRDACRRAAPVWGAAARNAWLLSAASAVGSFVSVLASEPGGAARFLAGVGERAVGVTLGILLAVVCALVALRLRAAGGTEPEAAPAPGPHLVQRAAALVVLLALFAWPFLGRGRGDQFEPLAWLLHPPALLATGGGALALALYLRGIGRGASAVAGLVAAGTIASLLGLAFGLHGFSTVRIADVAAGLMLAVSSGHAALLGLVVFVLPMLDRDSPEDLRSHVLAHRAACAFPLLVLAVLLVTVVLVMVPMEKAAG